MAAAATLAAIGLLARAEPGSAQARGLSPTEPLLPGRPDISWHCDPALARLFTPLHPQLGTYRVCTTPTSLSEVAPAGWALERMAALDAFGRAGTYQRPALAQLFGGRSTSVARGWHQAADRITSFTLVSPFPNVELTMLEAGTLAIAHTVPLSR